MKLLLLYSYSTVNTLLGGPRMSLGVTTAPTLQQRIGNMEYEYNSNSFISSSLSTPSNRSTNPFVNGSMQAHSSIAIPVTRQNILPYTLPTQTVTQTIVLSCHWYCDRAVSLHGPIYK